MPLYRPTEIPYRVAVRTLCEFTAKHGDLDTRFTPGSSSAEGIAGHRLIAARRAEDYQREVTLRADVEGLRVSGRADGYDPRLNRLEEFKTYRGDLARMADNQRALHWAQLKTYGALLCRERSLAALDLALVYWEVKTGQETLLTQHYSADSLECNFVDQCRRFLDWARQETLHRARRDDFLGAISFPHPALRSTQRHLAESVYRSACRSRTLMAQAPTGIGKTIGTLFPLLKAVPKNKFDKVFFLVAKTSGRASALETMRLLTGDAAADVRVLEYASRETACVHPDHACNAESCPLARGFYDRLPAARLAAIGNGIWDQPAIRTAAAAANICPYYLTQELARWCDVVVADYNYYFDARAALYGLMRDNQWRVAVLVDEAHNLLPRARGMYSATLAPQAMAAARQAAPPPIKKLLDRLKHEWSRLTLESGAEGRIFSEVPGPLLAAATKACSAILDEFADDPASSGGELQEFYFAMLQFGRLAETFGKHSLCDAQAAPQDRKGLGSPLPLLSIRNIIPAPFLAPRFSASAATVLFSATLSPAKFYRELLGLPLDTGWIDVESPFRSEQLIVRIARHISTRHADRPASVLPIVDLINRRFQRRPGNYLAFFSSFDYLRQVLTVFQSLHPDVAAWEQSRHMDVRARESFLARFTPDTRGVGFAVLGGIFGEGIDLPGDRLIGAFIATLGLPQINPLNAQIQQRMQDQFGTGYEYTYLYPGLQRVVQAAGRVIRTTTDSGSIDLIDDRFAHAPVRRLLPGWWRIEQD